MEAQEETQANLDMVVYCGMKWVLGCGATMATWGVARVWKLNFEGLTIIMQKGMANIELETDSQDARQLITDGADSSCPYRALIEDANFLLRRCKCRISYIPREANKCADALANTGVSQTEHFVFLDEPPNVLLSALVADMVAACWKSY